MTDHKTVNYYQIYRTLSDKWDMFNQKCLGARKMTKYFQKIYIRHITKIHINKYKWGFYAKNDVLN